MRRTERSMKMINRLNLSKKALAFLLAFSVLISTVTVNLAVFADVSPKTSGDTFTEGIKGAVWNGEVATGYAGGKGTKADPYLIETPNQLAYMLKHDVAATQYSVCILTERQPARLSLMPIYGVAIFPLKT